MAYGREGMVEKDLGDVGNAGDLGDLAALRARWPVVWVNVDGLGDVALLRRLGEIFGLHALALADVLGTHQRAKAEAYEDHLLIVPQLAERSEERRVGKEGASTCWSRR